jgi:glycosyltransferase involved in cell wall biosynthesis
MMTEEERSALRLSLGWKEVSKVICVVGSISPRKNQAAVLEMLQKLRTVVDVRIVVVGEAAHGGKNYLSKLMAGVEKKGLAPYVTWTGYVDDPSPYYTAADVCVLASENEGLPRVVIEALGYGCVVVATDVGGTREALAEPYLGKLVPVGDAERLFESTREALEFPQDQQNRLKRREYVEKNFSLKRYIDGMEKVVQDLAT